MSKKSSFVLYNDILEEILDLSDRDAGKLFKAIYYFAAEGKESKDDVPPKARTLYSIILKHLKKDEEKYKKRAERSRENGKNGGRPKMDTCGEENQNKPKETYWVFSEPRKPDNVNVNENVNGDSKGENKSPRFARPSRDEVEKFVLDNGYESEVNVDTFFDYYEANGWKVGKNSMKDWKATVRMWASRERKTRSEQFF